MQTTSSRERDQTFGQAIFALRSMMGLTQEQMGKRLGVSMRMVGKWEAGDSYPKVEHLKALIVLAVESEAFAPENEASEIRKLWEVAHQKMWLDERWLSTLLDRGSSSRTDAQSEASEETICSETTALFHDALRLAPKIQNLPFPPNPFFTGRETELLQIAQLFEQNSSIAITQPIPERRASEQSA